MFDTIFIAVGGGGLIAGAAAWFGKNKKIVAVEPVKTCALHTALKYGEPVDVEVSGIAVNALGAKRIGQICFNLAVETEMLSVLVTDYEILAAQKLLWSTHKQLVEPSGAAALAALGCAEPAVHAARARASSPSRASLPRSAR